MTTTNPKTVKVTLAKPHKHRGILRPAGTELDVRPDQAARMYRQGELKQKPDVPELKAGATDTEES